MSCIRYIQYSSASVAPLSRFVLFVLVVRWYSTLLLLVLLFLGCYWTFIRVSRFIARFVFVCTLIWGILLLLLFCLLVGPLGPIDPVESIGPSFLEPLGLAYLIFLRPFVPIYFYMTSLAHSLLLDHHIPIALPCPPHSCCLVVARIQRIWEI